MKATVYVRLKGEVLDPQGDAVRRALGSLGFEGVKSVRVGKLIELDLAFVDSLSAEEMRSYRGTLNEPGTESPYRSRTVQENLDLFRRMREGEFADGAHVLRLKIDMANPSIVAIRSGTLEWLVMPSMAMSYSV